MSLAATGVITLSNLCRALSSGGTVLSKPDEDGYFWMLAKVPKTSNSTTIPYLNEGSRAAFDETTNFQRMVKNGVGYAEFGHPKKNDVTIPMFMQRVREIYTENICAHIAEVALQDIVVTENNTATYLITLRVKPYGPRGNDLINAITTAKKNYGFSARCFVISNELDGVITRDISEIITFDFVELPTT